MQTTQAFTIHRGVLRQAVYMAIREDGTAKYAVQFGDDGASRVKFVDTPAAIHRTLVDWKQVNFTGVFVPGNSTLKQVLLGADLYANCGRLVMKRGTVPAWFVDLLNQYHAPATVQQAVDADKLPTDEATLRSMGPVHVTHFLHGGAYVLVSVTRQQGVPHVCMLRNLNGTPVEYGVFATDMMVLERNHEGGC